MESNTTKLLLAIGQLIITVLLSWGLAALLLWGATVVLSWFGIELAFTWGRAFVLYLVLVVLKQVFGK